ncbi:MAG: MFS transporter [Rhizobium sp.]
MSLSLPSHRQNDAEAPRHALKTLQGAVAALSFSILLAGSNANTPLLPIYRTLMAFSPLTLSLTFVFYVGSLIFFLSLLSRPSILRWAPALLGASLLASILSDLCMANGSEATTLFGRALTGIAVGLGTGPAAALVVDAFGMRGRSVSATGNLVGAVFGTALSQLAVFQLGGRLAIGAVFHGHALVCGCLCIILAIIFRSMRHANRRTFGRIDGKAPKVLASLRANLFPLVSGSIAWIVISIAITFLPSVFHESGMQAASAAGIIMLLICCAVCQLGSRQVAALAPWLNGMEAMAAGLALILLGAFSGWQSLGLLGFAVTGAGIGIAYRMALVVLTRGASPNIHGVLSSTYAAITYAAAAIAVTVVGLVGNGLGLEHVVIGALVLFGLLSAGLIGNAPRVSLEQR